MSDLSVTINADTTKFISAVKESKKELDLFDRSNKQLRSTMMKVNDVTEEQVNAFKNSVNSLNKVSSGTKNTKQSISILKDEVKKLSIQFNNLSDAAKKSKFGDTISNQVRKAKTELDRLKKIDNELKNSTIIKKDSELFKGVGDSVKDISSLVSAFNSGGLVSALGNLAGPLSVVTAAFAGLNEVIKNNETLLDRWQGIMSGAGNAWTNFMRTFNLSTIGASFKAGKIFYNASDALESYRTLNASYLGSILFDLQKAKTDKSEGKPWSNNQLEKLKKQAKDYYDSEGKMALDKAIKKREAIMSGLGSTEEIIFANKFFNDFVKAKNKYEVLENYKNKLSDVRKSIGNLEKKELDKIKLNSEADSKITETLDELKKNNKNLYAQEKVLDYFIESESSLNEYVSLLNDSKKSSQDKERFIKEVNEARAESKEKIEKNIQNLYKDLDKQKKIIDEENNKTPKDRDFGRLQTALKKYYEIEEKIYKQFGQFEGENSQVFWREWTNVEHAMLEGKDINEAIKKARLNILKYITEKGITVEQFKSDIEEIQKNIGKDWKWYKDITAKYYDDIYTDRIMMGVGSPEDILNIIQENIDDEVNQLTSKYPDPKSQSYFKEIADIYDKNLKYLKNYENEIESKQKELEEHQEKIKSMLSGELKDAHEWDVLNLEQKANDKLDDIAIIRGLITALKNEGKLVDEFAVETEIQRYQDILDEIKKYTAKYQEDLKETQKEIYDLNNYIDKLENLSTPYKELKNLRDSKLQEAGIRPYPAFVFNNYKKDTSGKDRINLLELETNAVNTLASAYGNVFDVINQISDGDDKINAWLQGILTGVQQGAKAWVEMSKIQLAASEAVALGKANASAAGLPFPYNLAAMATVTAAVLSTFSSFYTQFKGFANGGIVGGSSLGGDQMIARVNSGEMILNGSQQKKLFNLLNGNGTNTSTSIPEIKVRIAGSDLVGVLDNYGKKLNRVR